jgi:glycosyltransferase involved in cell wall biosynthesis
MMISSRSAQILSLPLPPTDKTGWPWADWSEPLPPVMPNGQPWPKISIVTPSYNQGQFIEETIRSILLQNYPNLEYIIIDGGSTDNSVEIIRKYESSLAYWVSEKDNGQADAINKGFERAAGDIYGFLNSDDYYYPGVLARLAAEYARWRKKKSFWVAFAVENFDANGIKDFVYPKATSKLRDWVDSLAWLHQPGVFWSKELYASTGGFDKTMRYGFDRKFFMAAVLKGHQLKNCPDFVSTRFRLHEDSKTTKEIDYFEKELICGIDWAKREASKGQRLGILVERFMARQKQKADNMLSESQNRPLSDALFLLLLAVIAYFPIVMHRSYWSTLKKHIL